MQSESDVAGRVSGLFCFTCCITVFQRHWRFPGDRRAREQQRHRCPAAGTDGDELVLAVRVTGLEIFLEWLATAFHVPGAIGLLRAQQPRDALLPTYVLHRRAAGQLQRGQDLSRGVRVALHLGRLRPAAVGALFAQERLGRF